MEKTAFVSATYFTIYSMFLFYQQSFTRHFQGSSQAFLTVITFFALIGYVVQIIYFFYYGWNVAWVEAIKVLLISIIIGGLLGAILEKLIGGISIVLLGFFIIPYCGYKMFNAIPIPIMTPSLPT